MFKLFGYTPGNQPMALEYALKTLSPEDRARVTASMHAAVSTRTPYDIAYPIPRPDGSPRDIRSRALAMADASGRVTHHPVGIWLRVTR